MKNKLVLWSIALLLLTGCGGNKVDRTLTIEPDGNMIAYKQTEFTVKTGQKIKLVFNNVATVPVMTHNVVIVKDKGAIDEIAIKAITQNHSGLTDRDDVIAATDLVPVQEQREVVFIAPEPGDYVYFCTFPGHSQLMRGVMHVTN